MKYFDNIGRKEVIVMLLLGYYLFGRLLSNYELFYYQASEVLYSLEALFFAFYIYPDAKKFKSVPKLCYAIITSLFVLNLLTSVRICSLKYYNSDKSASEIDEILAKDYSNYITEYTQPFIIFAIVILIILVLKLKPSPDE